jgi:hypothetical protein
MHDDTERNVAADSQTKRENDPFLHHLIDLSIGLRHGKRQVKLARDAL